MTPERSWFARSPRVLLSVDIPERIFANSWAGVKTPNTPDFSRNKKWDRIGRILGLIFFLGCRRMYPTLFGPWWPSVGGFTQMTLLYNFGLTRDRVMWNYNGTPATVWGSHPGQWPRPHEETERFCRRDGPAIRLRQKLCSGRLGDFNQVVPDLNWVLMKDNSTQTCYFERLTDAFLSSPPWEAAKRTHDGLFRKVLPVMTMDTLVASRLHLRERMEVVKQ